MHLVTTLRVDTLSQQHCQVFTKSLLSLFLINLLIPSLDPNPNEGAPSDLYLKLRDMQTRRLTSCSGDVL